MSRFRTARYAFVRGSPTAPWKVVYRRYAPYSSGAAGSPFRIIEVSGQSRRETPAPDRTAHTIALFGTPATPQGAFGGRPTTRTARRVPHT